MQQARVAGTGIAEILSESGVTRRSIYLNFPGGKSELVAAATRAAGDELTAVLRECIAQRDPIGAFTRVWSEMLVSTDFEGGCPIVAAAFSRGEAPEAAGTAAEVFAEWGQLLADRLTEDGIGRAAAQCCRRPSWRRSKGRSSFPAPRVDQAAHAGGPASQRVDRPAPSAWSAAPLDPSSVVAALRACVQREGSSREVDNAAAPS